MELRRLRLSRRTARSSEAGQVIVWYALLLPVLMMVVALAVNIGGWYAADAGLQQAADLSAVAGAQYLATGGTIPSSTGYPCAGSGSATGCATRVAGMNGVQAPDENAAASIVTFNGSQGVHVVANHPGFAGIFFSSDRTESATAIAAPVNSGSNTFPATFDEQSWTPGQHISWPFGTASAPGAFNLLQGCLGGSPSAQQLITCFQCTQTYTWPGLSPNPLPSGCAATSTCTATQIGQSAPGNKIQNPNVVNALNTLSGQLVLVPVYSSVTGSGQNAMYTIAGYAAILLDNPAATIVGSGNNQTTNLNGTFETFVLPGTTGCTASGSYFGVTTVYLVA